MTPVQATDDSADAVDQTAVIDPLIYAASPEKLDEWRALCARLGATFHCIESRQGVTLRARRRTRVEFDPKTMTWIWLLGFSGWRAFRLHGPHLFYRWLKSRAIDASLRAEDEGYAEAEADYEAIVYATRDGARAETLQVDAYWPSWVPEPQPDKTGFDIEQAAAFDITMIATAVLLVHEVRHVMFNVDGDRPASEAEEELICDAYARAFVLNGLDDYVAQSGEPRRAVLEKRAAGVSLAAYILYEHTPELGRAGGKAYPPVADRLDAFVDDISLPGDSWFWNFAAALLVAIVARRDRSFTVPAAEGQALCRALIHILRRRDDPTLA